MGGTFRTGNRGKGRAMTTIERSITVTSSPDRTFDYVSDVGNLPRYMDSMTSAELTGPEEVHVTAEVPDQGTEEGEAWFRTDPATRRVEWGSESGSDYHGWLQVDGDPGTGGSLVRLGLQMAHEDVDDSIGRTLETLRSQVDATAG